jgi:uncharacterized phage protein (TIGR01671 family)
MNREIKFRAWHPKIGAMLTVYVISKLTARNHETQVVGYEPNCRGYYSENEQVRFAYDEVEWMQFTGLTDKNGVEIYEGDVVRYESLQGDGCIGFVTYRGGSFRISYTTDQTKPIWDTEVRMWNDGINEWYSIENIDFMEIIGNIYEHPSLLQS